VVTAFKRILAMAQRCISFQENLRMWLRRLNAALFPSLIPIPVASREAHANALAHKLVRRYARGSSNLQQGRYVTAEDLEARKRNLACHNF
jgi:hypothetical protein